MLIAMAGLPGSGKSTVAVALQERLRAVVLDKDRVRAVLFPSGVLDYSAEQDEIAMTAIYQAAGAILRANPRRTVILDGRTFLRSRQVADLLALAASLGEQVHVIECVCDDVLAKERLERDQVSGSHLAGNRTFALHQALQAATEPLTVPRLVLDTGRWPLEECVRRSLAYLGCGSAQEPEA